MQEVWDLRISGDILSLFDTGMLNKMLFSNSNKGRYLTLQLCHGSIETLGFSFKISPRDLRIFKKTQKTRKN
jgi:hypothetical protein